MNKKRGMTFLLFMLTVILTLASTLAWFTYKTETTRNTFTIGNIKIKVNETTSEYVISPGTKIKKDPVVTVLAGSEDCYLFVKLDKINNFDNYMTYEINDAWIELDAANYPGVYYMEVVSQSEDAAYSVLKDDQVMVSDSVKKQDLMTITDDTRPELDITAFAVQKEGSSSPADAYEKIK